MILEQESIDVFLGLDVGKTGHHAVALNRAGKKLYDKALPQDETKIRDVLTKLAGHGKVLVVVDQPATIGALPVAVAQAAGAVVGYLPGLAMRRIADLHPGQAKTDARDAAIIAEAARSMPHTLRSVELDDETLAELGVLCGFDDDLAGQITATSNRIRGLLTQIHPALERALGPHLDHPAVADLLTRYPTPQALKSAGRGHVKARLKKHAPRAAERLAEAIFTALSEQTVVVVGTGAAGIVLPKLAEQLLALRRQRDEIADQAEALVGAHPLDLRTDPHRSHRQALCLRCPFGLVRRDRTSHPSIRGEHPSRRGNKKLKRALFLSAFAAPHHPPSRAYYDRKRAEGKRHSQAIIALARRRSDVLFAMLRDGTLYEDPAPKNLPSAA